MPRIPQNVGGAELATLLRRYGYAVTRQTGSHMRLTTQSGGEHHVTIPAHDALRIGTIASILQSVADHLGISRATVVEQLFE